MTARDKHDDKPDDMTPGDESNHITDHAKQDEIRRLLRGEEESSVIRKPVAEDKAAPAEKKRIFIRRPGAQAKKEAVQPKVPYDEPDNLSPTERKPAAQESPKRDDVSISDKVDPRSRKSQQITSAPTSSRRRKGSKKEQPISVLGFSASGKTVFLSMLYHATAESNKFHDHWKARWNDDETRTYLRDLGRSILGVKATGSPDWQDGSHTKVKRRFPAGTDEGKELLFSMSRSWCLKDFNMSYRTMDGSGEIIHRHFYVKPDEKTPRDHEKWSELSDLCRESKAVMLFINVMGLDVTHDTGEVRMMVEWLMNLKRPPKVVSVVVPGCDTIKSEKEILKKKQDIAEKYKPAFDMLDEHDVPYEIFMVSSLGNHMTRKKASLEGLPVYCKTTGHICQYCQELVDDPSVMPHPDGLHKPFEFIFKQLLPWYYRWAPAGIAVSILSRIRRFFFNRVTALLFLLALGAAYWFGRPYALDWMISETVKITPAITSGQMVQCKTLYGKLYSWDADGLRQIDEAFKHVDLYNALNEIVNSDLKSVEAKVLAARTTVAKLPAGMWKDRAVELLKKSTDLETISTIEKQQSFREKVQVASSVITPHSRPLIFAYAVSLLNQAETYFRKEVKILKRNEDVSHAEIVIRDLSAIINNVKLWPIPAEDKRIFMGGSVSLLNDVVTFKEKVETDRLWAQASELISAAKFNEASELLDKIVSSYDKVRATQQFKSYRDITDIGLLAMKAQSASKWDEALQFCLALKDFDPPEATESAKILQLSTMRMKYDDYANRYDKVLAKVNPKELEDVAKMQWAEIKSLEHKARAAASQTPQSVSNYEGAIVDMKAATEKLESSSKQLIARTAEMQKAKIAYYEMEETVDKQYLKDAFPKQWKDIQDTISFRPDGEGIDGYNSVGTKAYNAGREQLEALWSKAKHPQLISDVTLSSNKLSPFSMGGSKEVQFAIKASPGAKVSFSLSENGGKSVQLPSRMVAGDRYLHVCDWQPQYLSDLKDFGKKCDDKVQYQLKYELSCRILNSDDESSDVNNKIAYNLDVTCLAPKGYNLYKDPEKPSFLNSYPTESSIPLKDKYHIFSIISYPVIGLPRDAIDGAFGLIDKIPYLSIPVSTVYALPGRLLCKPWWRNDYKKFSAQSAGFITPSEWADQEWELFENARTWYWDENPSMILVAPLYVALGLPRDVIDMLFAGIDQVPYVGMPISYAYYPLTTVTKPWYASWGYTVGKKDGRKRVPYCKQSKHVIGITEWWDESDWVFFENLSTGTFKSKNYVKQSKSRKKWRDLMDKYVRDCSEAERHNNEVRESIVLKLALGETKLQ